MRPSLLAVLLCASCAHPGHRSRAPLVQEDANGGCPVFLRDARPVMGTWAELQLCAPGPRDLRADADAAFALFEKLEALWSTWRPQSEISRLNRDAGQAPVHVAPETLAVLRAAERASQRSSGLFDITFASLQLWHFDEDLKPTVPSPEAVAARLPLVDHRHVILDDAASTAFIDRAGTRVDLGGIGKGFAVDLVVALLRARGLHDFVIKAGGDLYCAGTRGPRPWIVGVRDPRDEDGGFFALMPVTDAAFSTSGDDERFFIAGGRRYHHIIDPRTGYPATASRSVTVLAPTATLAEGLSKPIFILGPSEGAALARREGIEAVIVGADASLTVTPGLLGRLQVLHPPLRGTGP